MKKNIAIIGTNGLPGNYGGWDQLVNHLTMHLEGQYNFIVYTSIYNALPGVSVINGAKIKLVKLKANGFQSIFYDFFSMMHAVRHCDILYICGTSGCIFLPFIKLFKKRIILNPAGLEWQRAKFTLPVKYFLKLSERIGIKYANLVIADNCELSEYINNKYNVESKVIEYGGDHVVFDASLSLSNQKKYSLTPNEYAFKVCRIVPENNIHIILEAFSKTSFNLVIVGNWDDSKYGVKLRKKHYNNKNIKLINPIYDQNTLDELRNNCLVYLHGHSVGGTNPSLVEAMNLGLFILAFDVVFNRETTENSALYFKSSEDLANLLKAIKNNEIDRVTYAKDMKKIANKRYRWKLITKEYEKIFSI